MHIKKICIYRNVLPKLILSKYKLKQRQNVTTNKQTDEKNCSKNCLDFFVNSTNRFSI